MWYYNHSTCHERRWVQMTRYTEKDAAKDTGVSIKEVNETWHQARDDARESKEIPSKPDNEGKSSSGSGGKK